MKKGAILIVGNEIMEGSVQDQNSRLLAQALTRAGYAVSGISACGDDTEAITSVLEQSICENEVLLICGGMGPTRDDVTRKALSEMIPGEEKFNPEVYNRIEKVLSGKGARVLENNKQLARIPVNAKPVPNNTGSAPGLFYEHNNCKIIALPGVPGELKVMLEEEITPLLKEGNAACILHKSLKTAGIRESYISEQLKSFEDTLPENIKMGLLPGLAEVEVRLTARGISSEGIAAQLEEAAGNVKEILGDAIYGEDGETLASVTGKHLLDQNKKLSVAESCTGGYLSHLITAVPGSSSWYEGGFVTYSNAMKEKFLNVPSGILANHGAVSEAAVKAMVAGATDGSDSHCAIATSGIAGPGGGSPEKPVGTIWVGVGNKYSCETLHLQLAYDRMQNIQYTALTGLNMIRKWLLKKKT